MPPKPPPLVPPVTRLSSKPPTTTASGVSRPGSVSKPAASRPASSGSDSEQTAARPSKLRWLLGWVVLPLLLLGLLFLGGVHVGARHPDMLLTRGVLWLGGGEAERPPQAASEPAGTEQAPQVASESAGAEAERLPRAASQPPELIQLDFGWPAPAQAIVVETIEEPGNNAKLRYRIEVERQGEKLLVHHRDPRVLELKGQPIDSDSNGAEIEGHLLLAGFIPSIVVAADGEFDRVIDMDAYIERTREALAASPEEHDAIAAIMNSPKMQWTLERRIGDIWRGWAEMWLELELMSDQGLRFESHEDVGEYRVLGFDAQTVSLEFRLDHKLTKSELHDMFGTIARLEGKEDLSGLDAELEATTGGKDLVATVTLRRDTIKRYAQPTTRELDADAVHRRQRRYSPRTLCFCDSTSVLGEDVDGSTQASTARRSATPARPRLRSAASTKSRYGMPSARRRRERPASGTGRHEGTLERPFAAPTRPVVPAARTAPRLGQMKRGLGQSKIRRVLRTPRSATSWAGLRREQGRLTGQIGLRGRLPRNVINELIADGALLREDGYATSTPKPQMGGV